MFPDSSQRFLPALVPHKPESNPVIERLRVKAQAPQGPPQAVRQLETSGTVFARGTPATDACRRPRPGTAAFTRYVNIVRKRVDALGLGELLGQGTQGQAYRVANRPNLVLKVTADRSEAAAAHQILNEVRQGKARWADFPALGRIYDVYGVLDDCDQPLPVFVVLQEFVPEPVPSHAAGFFDEATGLSSDGTKSSRGGTWGERIVQVAWQDPRPMAQGRDLPSDLRRAVRRHRTDLEQVFSLVLTIRKMAWHGVAWHDLHAGNVRQANGVWKIIDLGYSRAPNAEIATIY